MTGRLSYPPPRVDGPRDGVLLRQSKSAHLFYQSRPIPLLSFSRHLHLSHIVVSSRPSVVRLSFS